MKLPPLHNSRAPEQWEIISKHVDFAGKTVLDLGCGYADILFRCKEAGAYRCFGVEGNGNVYQKLNARSRPDGIVDISFGTLYWDINIWTESKNSEISYDVTICFSLLPYLDNALAILDWIKVYSEIALIECQYDGDGPGSVPWVTHRVGPDLYEYQKPPKDDNEMRDILAGVGWQSIEPIGKTLVEGRNMWRTIWLCR